MLVFECMKWVSLVPSWTETWLELGLNVVGRTRYCIHPIGKTKNIPIVGGTKDLNEAKLAELSDKDFIKLRKADALPVIYCHLASMNSWSTLLHLAGLQKS